MHFSKLKDLIRHYKDHIIEQMDIQLSHLSWSPYQEFILRTKEGQRRLKVWVDLLIRALQGDRETFFKDEKHVGYSRAIQGYNLNFSFQIHQSFQKVLLEILQEESIKKRINLSNLWGQVLELNEIIFEGYSIVAASFLKTREEIINEKVSYLQEIYDFTRKIIPIFDLHEIVNFILSNMKAFFGVERSLILLSRFQKINGIYSNPPKQKPSEAVDIMRRSLKEGIPLFMDGRGNISGEIDQTPLKRAVSVPILSHDRSYGVLSLYSKKRSFNFTEKELGLLSQLIYIMAVALENSFMLEEIYQGRQELRFLTGRIITIQEEERRRLASDIHDTLAQALTGINYKIQFCIELVKKDPRLLIGHLNNLLKTVNQAVNQSKELISSLHPHLIDTMGLVPALRKYIETFTQETGIRVRTHLVKRRQTTAEQNICLFRVAQEALRNVYKHAQTKDVDLTFQEVNGSIILAITDHGKGFDLSQGGKGVSGPNKLGLLSMKERVEIIGGTLMIDSGINRGCRIEARIPIHLVKHHA